MKTIGLQLQVIVILVSLVAVIHTSLLRKRPSYISVSYFEPENYSDESEDENESNDSNANNSEKDKTVASNAVNFVGDDTSSIKQLKSHVTGTVTSSESGSSPKILLCYYKLPRLHDRPYPVFPEVVNSSLCTHLVVCSARVENVTLVPEDVGDVQFYSRVLNLKKSNPSLKILLRLESINDETGADFVSMMSHNETRQRFIQNAVQHLGTNGFDGIEVSWEFPCFEGPSDQKQLFAEFLNEFREFINDTSPDLLLTVAVAARKEVIDIGYDIPGLARSVNFVSLMSYDYHTFSWLTPVTGPNAPKARMKSELAILTTLNMEWSANYWYQNGMPASKIIVGVPTYGRSFTLVDPWNHGYYAIASSVGEVGDEGYVTFQEVSAFLKGPNVTVIFDNATSVPYAYSGKEWISFENEGSAQGKASWIMQSGFGGVAVKDLNADDPYAVIQDQGEQPKLDPRPFPITQTIREMLFIK